MNNTINSLDYFYNALEQTKYCGTNQFVTALVLPITRNSYSGMTSSLREAFSQIPKENIEKELLKHIIKHEAIMHGKAQELNQNSDNGKMIKLSEQIFSGQIEEVKRELRTNEDTCIIVASSFVYDRYRSKIFTKEEVESAYEKYPYYVNMMDQIDISYQKKVY